MANLVFFLFSQSDFVGNLFHLMSGLNNLALNDTEIGLFAAIILLQSGMSIEQLIDKLFHLLSAISTSINRSASNI